MHVPSVAVLGRSQKCAYFVFCFSKSKPIPTFPVAFKHRIVILLSYPTLLQKGLNGLQILGWISLSFCFVIVFYC